MRSISPHDHTFPALDGLRGLAVALVLVVHTSYEVDRLIGDRPGVQPVLAAFQWLISMGGTGVHLFFVLSGFLLSLPFARHLLGRAPRPSVSRFYRRRALRILPAYFVVMALTVVIFERDRFLAAPLQQGLSHALLVHNYSAETFSGINGPTWTMAVEAQFYAVLPLLGALAWALHRRRPRRLVLLGLLLLVASPAAAAAGAALRRAGIDETFLTCVSFLSVFGAGMLGAYLYARHEAGLLVRPDRWARLGGACFVVVFGAFSASELLGTGSAALDYYGFAVLMGLAYLGLLLHVVLGAGAASRVLSSRAPRLLGDVSYSVYLVHYPLLENVSVPLAARVPDVLALPTAVVVTAVLVLATGVASFLAVERPFLERKAARRPDAVTAPQRTAS